MDCLWWITMWIKFSVFYGYTNYRFINRVNLHKLFDELFLVNWNLNTILGFLTSLMSLICTFPLLAFAQFFGSLHSVSYDQTVKFDYNCFSLWKIISTSIWIRQFLWYFWLTIKNLEINQPIEVNFWRLINHKFFLLPVLFYHVFTF